MHGGAGVMLDMVAIVKEKEIIDSAVMARRAKGVFEMPLQEAEDEPENPARQIDRQCKSWRSCA